MPAGEEIDAGEFDDDGNDGGDSWFQQQQQNSLQQLSKQQWTGRWW